MKKILIINGNPDKKEHTIQFGALTGLEAMTEGPLGKKRKGASYLISYRYAFTALAQSIGVSVGTVATPFYQDLSFKVNSGDTKLGKFTLFGLWGRSKIEFKHNKIDDKDLFADPTTDSYYRSDIGMAGVKHFIRLSNKSFINTVLGGSLSDYKFSLDTLDAAKNPSLRQENIVSQIRYSINTSFNSKINSRLFVKIGLIEELFNFKLQFRRRFRTPDFKQIWDFDDYTSLIQGYAHAKYNINEKLTLNLGLHSQYLTLSGTSSLEPRVGFKYQVTNKSTFSIGYGLHSQTQPLDAYFVRSVNPNGSIDESNRNLDFTRSQHYVIGYDLLPAKDWRVKTEVYYQYLTRVPSTINPSSFSMLNTGSTFNPNDEGYLQNTGTGENYGAELTVEKFFTKGYYGLMTGSIYSSTYKGSDGVKHNTAFNGKYVYNILIGKEFKIGAEKRKAFSIDFKMTQAGGRYFTPVDLLKSNQIKDEVLMGDDKAFSDRNPDFFRSDLKMGYTIKVKPKKWLNLFSLIFKILPITKTYLPKDIMYYVVRSILHIK